MNLCPNCGAKIKLGSIYCPECGTKIKLVDAQRAERAVEERKQEKMAALQAQLIQWLAVAGVLLVLACCFRNFAKRIPEVDTPAFFYGPAAVSSGRAVSPMVIGKGESYLDLGRSGLPVPFIGTLESEDTTPEEKAADEDEVRGMDKSGSVTVTMKNGKVINGKLLGRTLTHLTVAVGDRIEVLGAGEVESLQK